jgi:hypothetical protein
MSLTATFVTYAEFGCARKGRLSP